jgi:Protein of unknown function (DUF3606)
MARFTSNHVRPPKAAAAPTVTGAPEAKATGWKTLEELRYMVMSSGCTKAQFDEAVETVGDDPHRVASYLQRYQFSKSSPAK